MLLSTVVADSESSTEGTGAHPTCLLIQNKTDPQQTRGPAHTDDSEKDAPCIPERLAPRPNANPGFGTPRRKRAYACTLRQGAKPIGVGEATDSSAANTQICGTYAPKETE